MTLPKEPKPYTIVEGDSEPQDFQLTDDGVALVGTGFAVTLAIGPASDADTLPDTLPTVAWLDQAAGTVRVLGCENLAVGSYHVRFVLTDDDDKEGSTPNGARAELWTVVARV